MVKMPSSAFFQTAAPLKDSNGIKTASAEDRTALRKNSSSGKDCLGSSGLWKNCGRKKNTTRISRNIAESGATDVPPNSRDKNGMLVKGNATSKSAQNVPFSRSEKLAFIVSSEFRRYFCKRKASCHAR